MKPNRLSTMALVGDGAGRAHTNFIENLLQWEVMKKDIMVVDNCHDVNYTRWQSLAILEIIRALTFLFVPTSGYRIGIADAHQSDLAQAQTHESLSTGSTEMVDDTKLLESARYHNLP